MLGAKNIAISLVNEDKERAKSCFGENTKNRLKLYFRLIDGCCDEDGNSFPAGVIVDFGEANRKFEYSEIIGKININGFIEAYGLKWLDPEKLEIITPEEYEQEFGEGDN